MRYLIKFSYDGSHFNGFQRQSSKKTVQKELENAVSIINKKETVIKGAGRTDAGVHAYNQAAHFDLDFEISPERLKNALNNIVSPYIHINSIKEVPDYFHARFNCLEKKYIYKIWCGAYDPFKYDYYLVYDKVIHQEKLSECAKCFLGKHDFHNFVSGEREHYNAEITNIEIEYKESEIHILFTGKSFYRYMIRNLVGAILDYNEGKCDIITIKKMLEEKDFDFQLRTASPKGLYLEGVYYGNGFE